jgi:hypothetical protein
MSCHSVSSRKAVARRQRPANSDHLRRKMCGTLLPRMTPETTGPAPAGPVLARNRLLLAAREAETGEAEAE